MDIRSVSKYMSEDEVLFVPYTAVKIDHKDLNVDGCVIHASVVRDARNVVETCPTIVG